MRYNNDNNKLRNFIRALFTVMGTLILGLVIIAAVVIGTMYQFQIYQKKHGEQMTFMDFLFDSERK